MTIPVCSPPLPLLQFSMNAIIICYTNRSNTLANEHTGFDEFLVSSSLQWFSFSFNASPLGSCQVWNTAGQMDVEGTHGEQRLREYIFVCLFMQNCSIKVFKTNQLTANAVSFPSVTIFFSNVTEGLLGWSW